MSSPTDSMNPFPGLRPFRSDEKHLFFGREEQTAELLTLLRQHRFLAVVGTSGSGKSSLVRAGLLPELHGGMMQQVSSAWETALMRPGRDPIANLARSLIAADLYDSGDGETLPRLLATLRHSAMGLVEACRQSDIERGTNLLVVVDQFEELFRFESRDARSRETARAFVNLLLEASRQETVPLYIVLTMRSDYLGECSHVPGLAEAVNRGEYLIPRLGREQLRRTIEGPVQVGGGEIAYRLVQHLLNEVGEDEDQLPVLQHALMRTWAQWSDNHIEGDALDIVHYAATGGMHEALSKHADEVYQSLPDERFRMLAERVFKALTEKGPDNRGVRRPTPLGKLVAITGGELSDLITVVDAFRQPGVTFLMPGDDKALDEDRIIDISHESLMRVWRRLNGWVEAESQSARIYRRLHETAELHHENKAGLYHDPDLQIAQSWRHQNAPNHAWAEQYGGHFESTMAFLDKSDEAERRLEREQEAARQRELEQAKKLAEAERKRAEEQQRAAVRLRWLVRGIGLVALLAVMASVLAFNARREAQQNEEEARSHAEAADQAKVAAQRLQYFSDINVAESALANHDVGRANRLLDAHAPEEGGEASWEWRYLKSQTLGDDHAKLGPFPNSVFSIDYSPDEEWLGILEWQGKFSVWHPDTKRIVYQRPTAYNGGRLAFSPRENLLALGDNTSLLFVRIEEDQTITESSIDVGGRTRHLAFAPDGKTLALYVGNQESEDWQIQIRDVATGRELTALPATPGGETQHTGRVALSEDHLVFGGADGLVHVRSLTNLQEEAFRFSHRAGIASLAISPDGTLLATSTGSKHATMRLWNLQPAPGTRPLPDAESRLLHEMTGHQTWVSWLEFSSNGERLVSGGTDQTLRIWDLTKSDYPQEKLIRGNEDEVYTLALSRDGKRLTSGSRDRFVRFFELDDLQTRSFRSEQPVRRLEFTEKMLGTSTFSFSPSESKLAAVGEDGRAMLIDTESLKVTQMLPELGSALEGILFYPDGKRLLATEGGTFAVYDLETGRIVSRKETNYKRYLWPMRFSANGLLTTLGGEDGNSVVFWDADTLEEIGNFPRLNWQRIELGPQQQFAWLDGTDTTANVRLSHAPTFDQNAYDRLLQRPASTNIVSDLAFSDDERYLAASEWSGRVSIWDLHTRSEEPQQQFRSQRFAAYCVAFFQSNERLATTGVDVEMLKIWDRASRRELLTFAGTVGGFSPGVSWDDTTLAVHSDWRLLLWRAPTLDEIAQAIDSKTEYLLQLSDELVEAKALRELREEIIAEAEGRYNDGQLEPAKVLLMPLALSEAIREPPVDGGDNRSRESLLSTLIEWDSSPLVKDNAVWRYSPEVPSQAADWRDPDFDASGWKEGGAPLGYGDSWFKTRLERGNGLTQYFRYRFHIDEATTIPLLAISVLIDDGIVLYLNGTEILRQNMPDGPIDAKTLAIAGVVDDEQEHRYDTFLIPATHLRKENVLAAEVHNISAGSSDLGFGLRMASTDQSSESYLRRLLEGEDGPDLINKARDLQPKRLREEWTRKLNAFLSNQ